jgi:hypothetical protein
MDESPPNILAAGTIKFCSKLFANRMYLFIGAHQADENVFSSQVKNKIFARIGRGQLAQTRARGFEIRDRFKATRDPHESPW